jgi:hypothetical protein
LLLTLSVGIASLVFTYYLFIKLAGVHLVLGYLGGSLIGGFTMVVALGAISASDVTVIMGLVFEMVLVFVLTLRGALMLHK